MTDPTLDEALRSAIRGTAREAAPRLLADSFDDAYAEARSILRKLMVEALLQQAGGFAVREKAAADHPDPRQGQTRTATAPVDAGVYVYGFALSGGERGASLTGVNGLPASAIEDRRVAAIVSEMSGTTLPWDCGEPGSPDLGVLGARAQEHERVLQAILESGPVVPMRFGTVYPSRQAVLETLRAHHLVIQDALVALNGKTEWGLTVLCDRGQEGPALGNTGELPPADVAGRAYLNRREAEKTAAEASARQRREVATALHRAVEEVAAGSVVHAARRSTGPHDRDTDILLKASYLVDTAEREHFQNAIVDALEAVADLGLTGELTGPWPPYNFSRLELDGARA
jgi:hypothetical protein